MAKKRLDVFVSHSQQDTWLVREITDTLKGKGLSVWSDQSIRPGEEWTTQIEKALKEAKVFVFIVSPTSLTSNQTNFELGVALSRMGSSADIRIIPVTVGEVKPESLPTPLRRLAVVEAKDHAPSEVAAALVQLLSKEKSAKGL